ncbi:MAG: hypothetical protein ACOYJY_02400 [Acutalibacteraceae bacterium]
MRESNIEFSIPYSFAKRHTFGEIFPFAGKNFPFAAKNRGAGPFPLSSATKTVSPAGAVNRFLDQMVQIGAAFLDGFPKEKAGQTPVRLV